MKTLKLFFVVFLFTSMSLFPVIYLNRTGDGYDGDGEPEGTNGLSSKSSQSIRVLVINGAGYFLKSHSDFQLLLHNIEMGDLYGVNTKGWLSMNNNVISNAYGAAITYWELITTAESTPYNQRVIDQLRAFDYDGFAKGKGFNSEVYRKVKEYLSMGDINGVYRATFADMVDILNQLGAIGNKLEQGIVPDISRFWQLNQTYSNSLFLGQYIAMIFREL